MIKVHVKLIKNKCFELLFKNRQRLRVFNMARNCGEQAQLPRKNEQRRPGSHKQVLPMTIPWMQNEDFDLDDEAVEDHKYLMEPFHSVLFRSWLES